MPRRKPTTTPLTDLFIRRAAEGIAEQPWKGWGEIQVTPEDIDRAAEQFAAAGTPLSHETIEGAKHLAQEGIDERARRENS